MLHNIIYFRKFKGNSIIIECSVGSSACFAWDIKSKTYSRRLRFAFATIGDAMIQRFRDMNAFIVGYLNWKEITVNISKRYLALPDLNLDGEKKIGKFKPLAVPVHVNAKSDIVL